MFDIFNLEKNLLSAILNNNQIFFLFRVKLINYKSNGALHIGKIPYDLKNDS